MRFTDERFHDMIERYALPAGAVIATLLGVLAAVVIAGLAAKH